MTQPPSGPGQSEGPQQTSGQQDPHGAPPPPSYGTPPPPGQQPGNPYGPPPGGAPYGQPPFGQPPFGPPPFGRPSGYPPQPDGAPSKGLAIGALVSAFLCCLPVGLVLGIVVLRRSRDGRDHGKGLAIAAIVVNVLVMLASIAVLVGVVVLGSQVREVADLEPGDCISAEGLRGEGDQGFETITVEDCTAPHAAEVLATAVLTEQALEADEVDGQYGGLCSDAIAEDPARAEAALRDDVALLIIYDVEAAGEEIACLALAADGDQLDEPLVD